MTGISAASTRGVLVFYNGIVMAALYGTAQAIMFLPCGFFFFLSFFLFFLAYILSRRRLDVYHTSTHGVALVEI